MQSTGQSTGQSTVQHALACSLTHSCTNYGALALQTASPITDMDERRSVGWEPAMLAAPFSTQWFPSLWAWYVSCLYFLMFYVQQIWRLNYDRNEFMVGHFGNICFLPFLPGCRGFLFADGRLGFAQLNEPFRITALFLKRSTWVQSKKWFHW